MRGPHRTRKPYLFAKTLKIKNSLKCVVIGHQTKVPEAFQVHMLLNAVMNYASVTQIGMAWPPSNQ